MLSRPTFHIILTLSIIAILIGIVSIIFIQIDRGYISTESDEKFQQLQSQVIQHTYQDDLQSSPLKAKKESVSELIEQVKQDDLQATTTKTGQAKTTTEKDIEHINTLNQQAYIQPTDSSAQHYGSGMAYEDYESYWLSNNPWSPDYNPDRR